MSPDLHTIGQEKNVLISGAIIQTVLMPGDSCELNFKFSPTVLGDYNENLQIGCGSIYLKGVAYDPQTLSDDDILSSKETGSGGCSLLTIE